MLSQKAVSLIRGLTDKGRKYRRNKISRIPTARPVASHPHSSSGYLSPRLFHFRVEDDAVARDHGDEGLVCRSYCAPRYPRPYHLWPRFEPRGGVDVCGLVLDKVA